MKNAFFALLLTLCLGLTASGRVQVKPAQKQTENAFVSWVHGAWKTVQEEGKAGADRVAKMWPQKLKEVRTSIAATNKKVHDSINSMNLEQKRDTLVELWSLRKSLDIMALLNPEVLHSLTGLDASGLKSMEVQVAALTTVVNNRVHGR